MYRASFAREIFVVSFSLGTSGFSFFTDPALLNYSSIRNTRGRAQYRCAPGNFLIITVNIYKSRPS